MEERQKEEEKHGQEERKVTVEKQGLSHLCKCVLRILQFIHTVSKITCTQFP